MRLRGIFALSFISLAAHLAVLNISFVSFKQSAVRDLSAGMPHVFFGAGLLESCDLEDKKPGSGLRSLHPASRFKFRMPHQVRDHWVKTRFPSAGGLFKPPAISTGPEKTSPGRPAVMEAPHIGNSEPLSMYPLLPAYFPVYFRDRCRAHIGLSFRISPAVRGPGEYIEVKRKVSCGNLEADLIALRQVAHYLLLQRRYFQSGRWLDVNIDFSPSYDER